MKIVNFVSMILFHSVSFTNRQTEDSALKYKTVIIGMVRKRIQKFMLKHF
jgi:hypothetical protein